MPTLLNGSKIIKYPQNYVISQKRGRATSEETGNIVEICGLGMPTNRFHHEEEYKFRAKLF